MLPPHAPPTIAQAVWILLESSLLLDYLEPRDVLSILKVYYAKLVDQPRVFYHWVYPRISQYWHGVRRTPRAEYLNPRTVFELLEQLVIMETYEFDLHFDQTRCAARLHIREQLHGSLCSTHAFGSVFGDRECIANAVSYWECEGISEGCFAGIAMELDDAYLSQYANFFGQRFDERHDLFLAMKTRVCDLQPAIMYGQRGIITSGDFRGPKMTLPDGVNAMQVAALGPSDVLGIAVDLWKCQVIFLKNGTIQARIAIDRACSYVPVFSCLKAASIRIRVHPSPPWDAIYNHKAFRADAAFYALLPTNLCKAW